MGLGKTEWEDILIEKGIIKPPSDAVPIHHPEIVYSAANSNDELDEVDALFADGDSDNDPFIREYKAKRLREAQRLQEGAFGSMTEISRCDFVREVSDASRTHPVLVFLYQTSNQDCQLLGRWLAQTAAPANPAIKFIQIVSTRCIPNYPDANLPTVILYRQGGVQRQLLRADIAQTEQLIEQIKEAEAALPPA